MLLIMALEVGFISFTLGKNLVTYVSFCFLYFSSVWVVDIESLVSVEYIRLDDHLL